MNGNDLEKYDVTGHVRNEERMKMGKEILASFETYRLAGSDSVPINEAVDIVLAASSKNFEEDRTNG